MHAGMYSATAHLIKAVAQAKNAADGAKVNDRGVPTDDPVFGKGQIAAERRHIHPMYLYETKKPAKSKGKWDVFELGLDARDDVWRPLDKGGSALVKA